MKNTFSIMRSKGVALKAAVSAALFAVASGAHAALPAWATAMITDTSDNVTAVLAAIGPVVALSIGGFLLIKLVKRGANKI